MGLTSLFDSISTGFDCHAADKKYETAKSKARKESIDVESLEKEMYSCMGNCFSEEKHRMR